MGSEAKKNAKRAMQELFGNTADGVVEMAKAAFTSDSTPAKEGFAPVASSAKNEVTKIGADTVITGSVRSSGALEIRGTIYGDIISDDDVYFYGRVAGDVSCKNFYHYAGAVKGNVTATDNMEIEGGAILGDLKAVNIRSNGRVSGNIVTSGTMELLENAVVVGDINTKYFTMKDSACLRGVVHLEGLDRDVDSAFTDCFNF